MHCEREKGYYILLSPTSHLLDPLCLPFFFPSLSFPFPVSLSLPLSSLPQSNTQRSVVVVMLDPGMTEFLYVSVCFSKFCNLK